MTAKVIDTNQDMIENVTREIRRFLFEKDISQKWLAAETKISKPHLNNILHDRVVLTDENLEKINSALGTNFKNKKLVAKIYE